MSAASAAQTNAMLSITSGLTVAAAFTRGQAARAESRFQASQLQTNAALASIQARSTLKAGEEAAAARGTAGRARVGASRAALAAQGIDVNTLTAQDIQEDIREVTRLDVNAIRAEAMMAAQGLQVEAAQSRGAARFARVSGDAAASQGLLTGGLSAARDFLAFQRRRDT